MTPAPETAPIPAEVLAKQYAAKARVGAWTVEETVRNAILADRASQEERIREEERLRFEGDLDRWMKTLGAGITGYQPEAYAVMDAACAELARARDRIAALEASAAEGERRGLERSAEVAETYSRHLTAKRIRALLPEAPAQGNPAPASAGQAKREGE